MVYSVSILPRAFLLFSIGPTKLFDHIAAGICRHKSSRTRTVTVLALRDWLRKSRGVPPPNVLPCFTIGPIVFLFKLKCRDNFFSHFQLQALI